LLSQVQKSQESLLSACSTVLFQSNRLQYEFTTLGDKFRETGDLIDSFLGRMDTLDTRVEEDFNKKHGHRVWDTLDLEVKAYVWYDWFKENWRDVVGKCWNRVWVGER